MERPLARRSGGFRKWPGRVQGRKGEMNGTKIIVILLIFAAVFAVTGYSMGWFHRDTSLQGSGTVEARNIRVGSKIGGALQKVLVREGDTVQAGEGLVTS